MKKYNILCVFLMFLACSDDATVDDVFSNFTVSPATVSADGQSTVNVSVELTKEASPDRRNVVFTTSSGKFTSNDLTKCTVKAEYESGILTARAVVKVSTKVGPINVSVQPEFDSPVKEFVMTKTVDAIASVPVSIELETSAFGIASNHLNEVYLVGTLKNIDGKPVSSGYKVDFTNFALPSITDGSGGAFRDEHDTTGANSQVTAFFSADNLPIGTTLKIDATILNPDGTLTGISDSILLTINQ